MRRRTVIRLRLRLRRLLRSEHLILVVLAVIVGVAAGYGALVFRMGVGAVQYLGYGFFDEVMMTGAAGLPAWQLIAASALRGSRMSLRDGLVSAVGNAASIGVGASTGREGPVVHLGATLAAWVAARLDFDRSMSRTLLGCGVAAATTSLFNAPVAGVLFALELVVGHQALKSAAPIVIASVTGTMVSRTYFGAEPAFTIPEIALISIWEFPAFMLLGVVCALAAMALNWSILLTQNVVARTPGPIWLRPAIGGLAIGVIAIWLPHILGVGYQAADTALRGGFALELLLALIVFKIVATAISLGTGFGGGVFSPSLFLGAMVGGAFGTLAGGAFPELFSGVPAYALIGTAAVAGAVVGAPLTTIFIVFELTDSSAMTVAVMVATVIASLITRALQGRSHFHLQLLAQGINVSGGEQQVILGSIHVADVMRRDFVTVNPTAALDELREKLRTAPGGAVFVVDAADVLTGVVRFADLDALFDALFDAPPANPPPCAADLAEAATDAIAASVDLAAALEALGAAGERIVPVIRDGDVGELCGVVSEADLVKAYNRALLKVHGADHD